MRRHPPFAVALAAATAAGLLPAAGCGDAGSVGGSGGVPGVVVTTSILGDVVENMTGDLADVEIVMPTGADPHEFQPSARQAAAMREADLLVANGGGFEAGLVDTIRGAEDDGVPVFEAVDHVDLLAVAGSEGGGSTGDEGADPHVFTDPARMATVGDALAGVLADEVPALDTRAFRDRAAAYVAELRALDAEVEATLAAVPADRRKLVTNHDVFAYFADRYGFEIVGAVIPSTTTQAAPSAGEIDALAATIAAEGVPAIFADTSSPDDLADTLAGEVGGDVGVVELYSESLGEAGSGADSYVGMMRTDAARIAEALAP
ncbi:MAG TPA: metal ABC transporter substrate-binding protein [Acidimicrobiales bacterium]